MAETYEQPAGSESTGAYPAPPAETTVTAPPSGIEVRFPTPGPVEVSIPVSGTATREVTFGKHASAKQPAAEKPAAEKPAEKPAEVKPEGKVVRAKPRPAPRPARRRASTKG